MKRFLTIVLLISTIVNGKVSMKSKKEEVYSKYKGINWPKLPPPGPFDWLSIFPEKGQTLEEYKLLVKSPLDDNKKGKIIIQPLNLNLKEYDWLLNILKEYCEIFFQRKIKVLEPIEIPYKFYNAYRGQYNASYILEYLKEKVKEPYIALAGITKDDLYVSNLNFVFGLGNPNIKCGVYSFARYGEARANNNIFLKRILNVMTHEIGHIFGLSHCIFYKCSMNGSNSLKEADKRPLNLCPLCEDKLTWFLSIDKKLRREKLKSFFNKYGFKKEVELLNLLKP